MDTSQGTTDAYIEIKFGKDFRAESDVCHKSLNPTWSNFQPRFEISDNAYFQDNVLEIRVWDHDVFTSDNTVGFVFIDPNLLLTVDYDGYLPILDSLLGIRGELYVIVKVEWVDELNPFKDSSAGVLFSTLPSQTVDPSKTVTVERLVEEVTIEDDPEYHLIDSFRSSTKSNEQRQLLLFEMSGKTRRLIGRKTEEAGGNAVYGYQEYFDLEDENMVIRGLGTICRSEDKNVIVEPEEVTGDSYKSKMKNEVILCTLTDFEPYTVSKIGCIVSARSVKLISPMKKVSLAKQRDAWWLELREEIKSHAKTLECTHVLGYKETIEIHKDLCVLSAVGTAANLKNTPSTKKASCKMFHIPYTSSTSPFHVMELKKCKVCKRKDVPEVLITTIEPPKELECNRAVMIEARVCRSKKNRSGEANAKQVSDLLPFIEKDLNSQLLYKLKVQGMNLAFKLNYVFCVGTNYIIATATATCTLSTALPSPQPLEFVRSLEVKDAEDKLMVKTQEQIEKLSEFNRDVNDFLSETPDEKNLSKSFDERILGDVNLTPREAREELTKSFIVEIDDDTDEDNMVALLDPIPPDGLSFCNLKTNFQLDETRIVSNYQNIVLRKEYNIRATEKLNQYICSIFHDMYASIAFNINILSPCAIWGLESDLMFKSDNLLEVSLSMMALMVKVDEEANLSPPEDLPELLPKSIPTPQPKSPFYDEFSKFNEKITDQDAIWLKSRVEITPNYFVPGAKVLKHYGRLCQHFIRESVYNTPYGSFEQQTLIEVNALILAHVRCVGANCLLNFHVQYHVTKPNYLMMSIYGDICRLEYDDESRYGILHLIELSK